MHGFQSMLKAICILTACGWLRLKDMDMQMIYLMPVSLTAREKSGNLFFGCYQEETFLRGSEVLEI